MLVSDILEQLDLYIVSPYSDAEKIIFLNSCIENIKRFAGVEDVYTFTSAGFKIYPLPPETAPECVKCVTVSGREIPPAYDGESGGTFFFLVPSGYIGFSFAPKTGERIEITYSALKAIEAGDTKVRIDPEYVPLLITGAAADIAAATEDISLSNNLRAAYNRMYSEARQNRYRKRGAYPKTGMRNL